MKNYIIAWFLTAVTTLGGLFAFGFAMGLIIAPFMMSSTNDIEGALEASFLFNTISLIAGIVINFLCFKLCVRKFIVDKL